MIPAITDIMRSLSDIHSNLDRLSDLRRVDGAPASRTTMFAEFAVEWMGGRWLLCTPLREGVTDEMARMAVRLRALRPGHIAEFRVFRSELRFTDSAGGEHRSDVVMQHMPAGVTLAESVVVQSREHLLRELDDMQAEFARMEFSHNNLKPENIIVANDGRLMAVRCHFARFGAADGDSRAFESLRRFVASLREGDVMTGSEPCRTPMPEVAAGYEIAGPECEQRIPVTRDGLYGYADSAGAVVIEPQFDMAGEFREGRAQVSVNGRMGLIDKSGRYVIPPRHDSLEYHDGSGISLVCSGGEWTAFDYEGYPTGICHGNAAELCRMIEERMKITIEI